MAVHGRSHVEAWVPKRFDELNAAHLDGKLKAPLFQFWEHYHDPVTKAEKWGMYVYSPGVSIIVITYEALAVSWVHVSDVLLHEMVHHAEATLFDVTLQNHGKSFTDIANRIARELGLGEVEPDSTEADVWPQTLRP